MIEKIKDGPVLAGHYSYVQVEGKDFSLNFRPLYDGKPNILILTEEAIPNQQSSSIEVENELELMAKSGELDMVSYPLELKSRAGLTYKRLSTVKEIDPYRKPVNDHLQPYDAAIDENTLFYVAKA